MILTAVLGFGPTSLPGQRDFTACSACFFYLVQEKRVRTWTSGFVLIDHFLAGETEAGSSSIPWAGAEWRAMGCLHSHFTQAPLQESTSESCFFTQRLCNISYTKVGPHLLNVLGWSGL